MPFSIYNSFPTLFDVIFLTLKFGLLSYNIWKDVMVLLNEIFAWKSDDALICIVFDSSLARILIDEVALKKLVFFIAIINILIHLFEFILSLYYWLSIFSKILRMFHKNKFCYEFRLSE